MTSGTGSDKKGQEGTGRDRKGQEGTGRDRNSQECPRGTGRVRCPRGGGHGWVYKNGQRIEKGVQRWIMFDSHIKSKQKYTLKYF